MKTITLTKEVSIDELDDEFINEVARQVVPNCRLHFESDGKSINIHHECYDDDYNRSPKFDLLKLFKSGDIDEPNLALEYIETLNRCIDALQKIVDEG